MSVPLFLLTDGRFPAGGYAHSGGLEAAVEAGLQLGPGLDGVQLFLAGRLRGVAAAEAALALAAARAARTGDLDALLALDDEAQARCPSPPLRAAASRLGAQLLRTAAVVWPDDATLAAYREKSGTTPRPVAFGAVSAAAGLPANDLAQAYLYEDATTVTAAAVKLLPVDAADAARWLIEAEPLIARLADDAMSAPTDPRLLPAGFAPALELRSLAHAAREGRLFAS